MASEDEAQRQHSLYWVHTCNIVIFCSLCIVFAIQLIARFCITVIYIRGEVDFTIIRDTHWLGNGLAITSVAYSYCII